jgi:hypothetical protein
VVIVIRTGAEFLEHVVAKTASDLIDQLLTVGRVLRLAGGVGFREFGKHAPAERGADAPAPQRMPDHVEHGILEVAAQSRRRGGIAAPDPAGQGFQFIHEGLLKNVI